MKQWLVWILLLLAVFFAWWSYEVLEYESQEQNLTHVLEEKVRMGYLDEHILTAIKEEKFDDVLMYENLAGLLGRELLPSTLSQIEAHNGLLDTSWRNVKAFTSGFLKGESESGGGMSGSIASALTLYGDLRDLNKEGSKYMDDKPYDAFILNISLVGVGLSASQLLTAGASTPLKVGASVLKVAKKTGKLTKAFTKELSTRLSKTVDTNMLKTLDFNSLFSLKSSAKTIEKSINMKPVKTLFTDINLIKSNTSLVDTIGLMKYVDTPKDLKNIGKISKQYTTNTKGVMRILGKGALRAGKSIVKITTKLLWRLGGFILSILGFFTMLVFKYRSIKKLKGIAS
jgi:hypothetical protein